MTSYVVKIGGHALDSLHPTSEVLTALARDVLDLRRDATNVAIVHGGGPQIQTLLDRVGIASDFHEGLRVTDSVTVEFVAMALAQVNVHLVAAFNRAGLASVGLTGADRSLLRASALGAPWGRVGDAPSVDVELIESLWVGGVTPVVSSIALDGDGDLVNCNADTVAGAVAGALGADALILLSDVAQLRTDPLNESTSVESLTGDELRHLFDGDAIRDGMRPKMHAALDALEGGAQRVLLANGTEPHALRDVLAGSTRTTELFR